MSTVFIDVGMEYLSDKKLQVLEHEDSGMFDRVREEGYYLDEQEARDPEHSEYGCVEVEDGDPLVYSVLADEEPLMIIGANNNGHGDILVIREVEIDE